MRVVDIIEKKKRGNSLSKEEIDFIINGYVENIIPDYQISAFLMAVCFKGMDDEETYNLTQAMLNSGEKVDLSDISGVKVDKHSTGGVGDKTTLVVAPLMAACGGVVAKMSGRGLGFTGGTLDKLEAIPGFRVSLTKEEVTETVNKIGVSVIGQTANIVPADKKLYALRDVTGTIDSIPLIASSIMSKKLASGSDKILLDVTVGSGAFMKDIDDARELARQMIRIGNKAGKETKAMITNMDTVLGVNVGNSLEVIEAIETLKGNGPEDFNTLITEATVLMLKMGVGITDEEARKRITEAIESGKALEKLAEMVRCQGGDPAYVYNPGLFKRAQYKGEFKSKQEGYIKHMNTEGCGICACILGAGRETKESDIDFSAGIEFIKKTGDYVSEGEVLACLYSNSEEKLNTGLEYLKDVYTFSKDAPPEEIIIHEIIE